MDHPVWPCDQDLLTLVLNVVQSNGSPCLTLIPGQLTRPINNELNHLILTYLFGLKLINKSEQVAYFTKIAGKRRRLVQQ